MSTYNWLDFESLGSWPTNAQKLPYRALHETLSDFLPSNWSWYGNHYESTMTSWETIEEPQLLPPTLPSSFTYIHLLIFDYDLQGTISEDILIIVNVTTTLHMLIAVMNQCYCTKCVHPLGIIGTSRKHCKKKPQSFFIAVLLTTLVCSH